MKPNLIIGIDVSKSRLDYVCVAASTAWESLRKAAVSTLANEVESIQLWLNSFAAVQCLFVLEPTGSYSDKLLSLLHLGGYSVALINPRDAHHLSQLLGVNNKTDAHAARLLAYYGLMGSYRPYQAPSGLIQQRKRILTTLEGLMRQKQMLINQLHAQAQYYEPCPCVKGALEAVLETLISQITQLEAQLEQLKDPAYSRLEVRIQSVVGVGPVISRWLLGLTGGLDHFDTAAQLVKWAGLAPGKHQSGSSVNRKTGISKQARAKLRGALFMGAKSACRYNHACKDLYLRLRQRGKTYFQAIVAVMAKMLKQIFGVVKSDIDFDNDFYLKFRKNLNNLAVKT